jgi:peptidoglycan hydrolase-like protein with peptidoglycan-binding domain
LIIGLAVGGVFSSSKPRTAASLTTTGAAGTTTAPTATKPSRVAAPSVPLKPGDSGAQVKVLQRALARLGYASGAVDGSYGPSTQAAVAKFQHAAGLTADGVVGPKTRRAIRTALNNR